MKQNCVYCTNNGRRSLRRQNDYMRLSNTTSNKVYPGTCRIIIFILFYGYNTEHHERNFHVSSFQVSVTTPSVSRHASGTRLGRRRGQTYFEFCFDALCRNDLEDCNERKIDEDVSIDDLATNGNYENNNDYEPNYCVLNLDDVSQPYVTLPYSKSTFIEYTYDGQVIPAGPIGQAKEITANFLIEPSVEIIVALVVLLNSSLVALSTFDALIKFTPAIRNGEIVIGVIFLVDFIARWFSLSKDAFRFVLDPQFFINVLVVILPLVGTIILMNESFWKITPFLTIPSALSQPSGLFNLRLLRVLRLRRFLQDLETFEKFTSRALEKTNMRRSDSNVVKDWQLQLARVVLLLFTLLSVSTGLIYTAEQSVNPNINNYFDALYFGLTTLTTVGFGDVSPVTWQGKLVVCGSIVFGVVVVPGQAAALLEALLDRENVSNNIKLNTAAAATAMSSETTGNVVSATNGKTEIRSCLNKVQRSYHYLWARHICTL